MENEKRGSLPLFPEKKDEREGGGGGGGEGGGKWEEWRMRKEGVSLYFQRRRMNGGGCGWIRGKMCKREDNEEREGKGIGNKKRRKRRGGDGRESGVEGKARASSKETRE